MSKKNKNIRHTEAIRRKLSANNEMAKIGLSLEDKQAIVGFVFSHLAISHLSYFGLSSINNFCKNHVGVDICIFSQHIIPPCIIPLCPIFKIADLSRWAEYPLISTSIETTIDALTSNAGLVYHYCFDPEFVNQPNMESHNIRRAFCDDRVRVIARHESHRELIEEEFGINICNTIIPDCDVEKLMKLVLTEMKNGQ